jgi:hypothetical protein
MHIGDRLIEAVHIDSTKDIATIREELLDKYFELIESSGQDPVFYIEGVPSKANYFDQGEKMSLN